MDRSRQRWLVAVLLCAATVAVFAQVRHHAFIDYDDNIYITQNSHLELGLSAEGVRWAVFESFGEYWIPLTYLTWLAEYEFSGIDAAVHHLDNVWIHLASTLLLFAFLTRTTGAVWRSGFVALVFAVHPLHVESVAWATERRDTLAGFFWMAAMVAYASYVARPFSWPRYLGVAACLGLGLLAKPLPVTLPFALLLLDLWPLRRLSNDPERVFEPPLVRRAVLEKLGLLPLVIATSVIAFLVQQGAGAMTEVGGLPVWVRVANAFASYAAYLGVALWPADLGVFYPHPGADLSLAKAAMSAALVLGITVFALREVRRRPWLLVGWLWYLGTLVPMIGFVQVGIQAMADRHTYIPLIGIAIIVAWGSFDVAGSRPAAVRALVVLAAAASLALSVASWRQVGHWRDTISLFAHTLSVTGDNPIAERTLGYALMKEGRLDEAIAHLRMAVSFEPRFAEAHHFLGNALARRGTHADAITSYQRALRGDPTNARLRIDLADSFAAVGRSEAAATQYRDALARGAGPDAAQAYVRLGSLLAARGDHAEAIEHYESALRLEPELVIARRALERLRRRGF
ncbi:MAG: tetratricopeptide repeat protein [Myxococcales bacterium]|nr:tetratricopeptide repeat protein [Myxococcales bacterium]